LCLLVQRWVPPFAGSEAPSMSHFGPAPQLLSSANPTEVFVPIVPPLTCPECGSRIQTLDLPCPFCTEDQAPSPAVTLHQYSKTFEYRPKPFQYSPDVFTAQVNDWLGEQFGLANVTMTITFFQGRILTVTVNCTASNSPESPQVRLERVPLPSGFLGRNRQTPGDALNEWADRHPDRRRLNYWTPVSAGAPVELWILYVQLQPVGDSAA